MVRRALLERKGPKLDANDISFEEAYPGAPEDTATPALELPAGVTLEQMMERLERQLLPVLRRLLFGGTPGFHTCARIESAGRLVIAGSRLR
ncbi:hypothetical protein [Hyalangium minutum]|uniref:Response regulator of zinc sigma-54-dependent two-component system n=1 Tax=Hyalangium minutum TaxID=394096 RepID=A0A085VSN5_9BACT|nr:hypothetical protein [Hyalangium minutum]KFE58448.1 Response regulator of zinc sigma-54-dependent two-component system [Hyalangium minutum]KFE60686.1 Response regulator of zinc sigma-54-dependent two-component system [Hyalangium minutum]